MLESRPNIHPTAVIAEGAQIGPRVEIGPYCVVGPNVALEPGTRLHAHVVIAGDTLVGEDCEIFPFASIGQRPQDLKYAGEKSRLIIGSRNVIREHVTLNPGTSGGGLETKIGCDGLFMAGSHVAHDCVVGDHVIFANNATLAGHCIVGDHAILGGLSAVHQFVRIGSHAFIGGMSGVGSDVIPFGSVIGNRAKLAGLNLVGLKRHGFKREIIHALRHVYRGLFEEERGTLQERAAQVDPELMKFELVMELVEFVRASSNRAICVPG